LNLSHGGQLLAQKDRQGERPIKEDPGLAQTVLLQELAKVLAHGLRERNGVS
jgi:hypothetical protein